VFARRLRRADRAGRSDDACILNDGRGLANIYDRGNFYPYAYAHAHSNPDPDSHDRDPHPHSDGDADYSA